MVNPNMLRDDAEAEFGQEGDPNSDGYWAERGMKRPQVVWERLSASHNIETYRTKVPGGWMVLVCQEYRDCGGAFFYPDPAHRWDGTGFHG